MLNKNSGGDSGWIDNFPEQYRGMLQVQEREQVTAANTYQKKPDLRNIINLNISAEKLPPYSSFKKNVNEKSLQGSRIKDVEMGRNLWNINLRDADKYKGIFHNIGVYSNETFNTPPIQIDGLEYSIFIGDSVMLIGCRKHTLSKWKTISDKEILGMDGKKALAFWRKYKHILLGMADAHNENG